mgnify:CR=1 FL=1
MLEDDSTNLIELFDLTAEISPLNGRTRSRVIGNMLANDFDVLSSIGVLNESFIYICLVKFN